MTNYPKISCMNYTNGLWNVSFDFIQVILCLKHIYLAVGRVSLDTRLGCLTPEGSEESQQIINSINTFFWAVPELELRMPLWRFYPTKAYKAFVKALDDFTE